MTNGDRWTPARIGVLTMVVGALAACGLPATTVHAGKAEIASASAEPTLLPSAAYPLSPGRPGVEYTPTCGDPGTTRGDPGAFTLVQSCQTISGFVSEVDLESGGSYRVLVRPELAYSRLFHPGNLHELGRALWVRVQCPTTSCAIQAHPPAVGDHVFVTGALVTNKSDDTAGLEPVYKLAVE